MSNSVLPNANTNFLIYRRSRRERKMLRLEEELREELKDNYEKYMVSSVKIAREIAMHAHKNQKRLNGAPYFLHPYRMADTFIQLVSVDGKNIDFDAMYDLGIQPEGTIEVCLLHDVLEDTDYTIEEIGDIFEKQGYEIYYTLYIERPLLLITHDKNEPYPLYIEKVCQNPISAFVKFLDLNDNTCVLELDKLTDFEIDRMHKYALYMKRINDQYHFIEKLNGYNKSLEAQAN